MYYNRHCAFSTVLLSCAVKIKEEKNKNPVYPSNADAMLLCDEKEKDQRRRKNRKKNDTKSTIEKPAGLCMIPRVEQSAFCDWGISGSS